MSQLLAQAPGNNSDFGTGLQPPSAVYGQNTQQGAPERDLELIVSTGIGMLSLIATLFFIVYFFLGALKWVTAGGDSGKVGKARDEMIQGVVGLIVVVAAYGIIGLIGTVLGIDILNPARAIQELTTFG